MSRIKKSRKPGAGSIGIVKEDKKKVIAPEPRKPKKKKGKQAGNRQKEAVKEQKVTAQAKSVKDARIGSKKPIDLGQPVVAMKKTKVNKKPAQSPIAAIRVIDVEESITDKIERIEQDAKLLTIIEKQEADIALTEQEVDYYNKLMEQHEALTAQLTIDDEMTVEEKHTDSEDELWDKFDNSDLSRFE